MCNVCYSTVWYLDICFSNVSWTHAFWWCMLLRKCHFSCVVYDVCCICCMLIVTYFVRSWIAHIAWWKIWFSNTKHKLLSDMLITEKRSWNDSFFIDNCEKTTCQSYIETSVVNESNPFSDKIGNKYIQPNQTWYHSEVIIKLETIPRKCL